MSQPTAPIPDVTTLAAMTLEDACETRSLDTRSLEDPFETGSLDDDGSSDNNVVTGLTLMTPQAPWELKFEDFYELKEQISKGSFGIVFMAERLITGEHFAVKKVDRGRLTEKDKGMVDREVALLLDCRDIENIVQLIDVFHTPESIFVVQIYAEGGDLFKRLATRMSYTEKDARDVAINLLGAVAALHSRKIAHRDLKPENLLLRSMYDDSSIMVADFGFAAYVPEDGLKTRCGTPAFVAPEVLEPNAHYDEAVDCWSVGCLLFMLIAGYPPFQDKTHVGLFRKIRGADYCFHESYWANVSVSAKQLIASLLTVETDFRCSAQMALENSHWLKMKPQRLEKRDLSASLAEIKKFNARRHLKGALHVVRWSVKARFRMTDDIMFSKKEKEEDKPESLIHKSSDNTLLGNDKVVTTFAEVYELKEEIYKGKSATIYGCLHKYSQEYYAVKIIERANNERNPATGKTISETVLHEAALLDSLDHKNIIKFIEFFEEDDRFYMVMERCYGGDLFDRICQKKHFTEKDARDLARVLLEGVAYLHAKGIAHRDLKPQNLLLKRKDNDSDVKISDFGFACRVHTPESLTTRCGTPSYVAPEILKNVPYDQSADMWSVGVILYALLCGYPPISDSNQNVLFQKIRRGEWKFDPMHWDPISKDAKEFIRNLLVVNPKRRWTAQDALTCSWLRADGSDLSKKDLRMSLETFRRRKSSLKGVAKAILMLNASLSARSLKKTAVAAIIARPGSDEESEHIVIDDDEDDE